MKKIAVLFVMMGCSCVLSAQRDTLLWEDWKFAIDKNAAGFAERWFEKDLVNAGDVHIPHTWNVKDESQNHYGWGWYQRKVFIPKKWKDKNIVLEFGAVNHTSVVYINGEKVHENIGDGFNKYFVSLNHKVHYEQENVITVAANNDYGKTKVPFGSSFDWPNDGGIIRPVRLIVSNRPAAKYMHALPVWSPGTTNGFVELRLGFDEKSDVAFNVTVTEENQPTKNRLFQKKFRPSWNNKEALVSFSLPEIHPWHFDFPNLYRIDVTVLKKDKPVDKLSANIGFRKLEFQKGQTFLNGERIKLMGVEWTAGSNPDFGLAESDSVINAMGQLMKSVNCIFSRQHFQQGDVFYDFCDRNGILVQQEVPLWGPETPANDTIRSIAMQQLERMVQNLYNHPSIFSWGAGNELRAMDKDMKAMIADLLKRSKQLDPSRNTAYVSNTLTEGFYNNPGFIRDAAADGDYLMMNEYGGSWWSIPSGKVGMYLDSVHQSYPDKPFFISEFGLCEPNFKGGDERRIEDLIYHMGVYESRPYVEGAIYFDLTDYRTHYPGTPENNKFRRRIHGVYDMYGTAKASMKVLRELSSPIEVQNIQRSKNGKLAVLVFGSVGLPQHTARGYKLYLSDQENNFRETKAYDLPELKPGEKAYVEVDTVHDGKVLVTIVRPTGYVATQKSFR